MTATIEFTADTTIRAVEVNQDFNELGMLGYAQAIADQTSITTVEDLDDLAVTVTISTEFAAANRRIKISFRGKFLTSVSGDRVGLSVKEGTDVLQVAARRLGSTSTETLSDFVTLEPSSGAHTYKLTAERLTAQPAEILVEAI